jgi:hypothetical protein
MRVLVGAGALVLVAAGARSAIAQSASGGEPSASAGASDPATAEPPVVTVHGRRTSSRKIGSDDFAADELRDIPGTFGDPFQAVASLPGVVPVASGLPYFYVRGAPPANTGYFLDGIPLPALFHVGPGPSVVPPSLLESVEFFPSTAPASYGRFAGGVIAGELRDPSPVPRGEASVRLFDASAVVETPAQDGWSLTAGGRYGYPNLLLALVAPNLSLSYGDYTVRLTRQINAADRVSVLALGSFDSEHDASGSLVPVDTIFHRVDLRFDHKWSDGALRVAATFGSDRTTTRLATFVSETVQATSGRLRLELTQRLASGLRVEAGADANATLARTGASDLVAQQVGGAYVDVHYDPMRSVSLVAGARVDAYRSGPQGTTITTAVDPRLALQVRLAANVTSITTVGIAHQPPTFLLPVPGLLLDPADGLQTTYQYAQGIELRLPWALRATVTGFYNADRNMNDFASDCGSFAVACDAVTRVDGETYGLEVIAQRAFSQHFAGWVSYTLSRADRRIGGVPFLSPFDRTHVLSAVARYDFGNGIDVGIRATYNTGRPDIPSVSRSGGSVIYAFSAGAVPQHRLPAFYRIDLRAEKKWTFDHGRWLALTLEFFDATLNKEAVEFQCDVTQWRCTAQTVGPIALPSIGVEGGF